MILERSKLHVLDEVERSKLHVLYIQFQTCCVDALGYPVHATLARDVFTISAMVKTALSKEYTTFLTFLTFLLHGRFGTCTRPVTKEYMNY